MADYPSTSPWGPHGPQVPAHSVTPNPTAQSTWSQPSFGGAAQPNYYPTGGYGGRAGAPVYGGPPSPPKLRRYWVGWLLSLLFGPLALFMYMKTLKQIIGAGLLMLAPFAAMAGQSAAAGALWLLTTAAALVWTTLSVRSNNRKVAAWQRSNAAEASIAPT